MTYAGHDEVYKGREIRCYNGVLCPGFAGAGRYRKIENARAEVDAPDERHFEEEADSEEEYAEYERQWEQEKNRREAEGWGGRDGIHVDGRVVY